MLATELSVLIVDDFEMSRRVLLDILGKLGVTKILEADSGTRAKEILVEKVKAKEPIDIIFSDWNMPEFTGLDLLKFTKSEEALSKIPFVMVTAESEASSIMSAIRSGAYDYVVKPIDFEVVSAILERIVNK